MPVLKVYEKKNVWETICQEFQNNKSLPDKKNEVAEFDPAKHSLVFYGQAYTINKLDDDNLIKDFDPTVTSPICLGYTLQPYVPKVEVKVENKVIINRETCSEKEFIEHFVFPTLLPALEKMLAEAEKNNCFKRKRTAFNACDYLADYLYKNNPFQSAEELAKRRELKLFDIPFAKEWLKIHPRQPLPKSLLWSETDAVKRIQAFFRGYRVRLDPEVQELRKWQRELREENQNITQRVEKFWNDSHSANLKKSNNNTEHTSSALFSSSSMAIAKN